MATDNYTADDLKRMKAALRKTRDVAQWVDAISQMTGAQLRAAQAIPAEMAAQIGDDEVVLIRLPPRSQ